MFSKVAITVCVNALFLACVMCEDNGQQDKRSNEYPVKKAPRFLFMETMAAIMAGMWTSMMATAGYLSLSAFEASYDLNCIACKCYDNCVLYKNLERQVCATYWDTINCLQASTPASMMEQRTTLPPVTITPSQVGGAVQTIATCSKFCTVAAVAKSVSITNPIAPFCPDGKSQNTPEAYLMSCCSMNVSSSWQQGPQVMSMCENLDHYTPVAKFNAGVYVPNTAGVFIACANASETGFQFAHQTCGETAELIHVSNRGNKGFQDPESYYVIVE